MTFHSASILLLSAIALQADPYQPAPMPPDPKVVIVKPASAFLGVGVVEVDDDHGVKVTRVEDESPAAQAGIKAGDLVLEYNGQRVEGMEQFMRLVRETPAGREVKLTVSRNGSQQSLTVKTGSRKVWIAKLGEDKFEIPRFEIPEIRMPDVPRAYMSWRSSIVGIEAETLDSQLAQYFGVKEGVLIRAVTKGSAAERAGLKAGDVILKVDETRVTSPREVSNAVRAARSKKSVAVQVMRDRHEMTTMLSIEDETEGGQSSPRRQTPRAPRPD